MPEATTTEDKDKVSELYDILSTDENYAGTLPDSSTFREKLSDKNFSEQFYGILSADENYKESLPDFNSFYDTVKKKEQIFPTAGQDISQGVGAGFPKISPLESQLPSGEKAIEPAGIAEIPPIEPPQYFLDDKEMGRDELLNSLKDPSNYKSKIDIKNDPQLVDYIQNSGREKELILQKQDLEDRRNELLDTDPRGERRIINEKLKPINEELDQIKFNKLSDADQKQSLDISDTEHYINTFARDLMMIGPHIFPTIAKWTFPLTGIPVPKKTVDALIFNTTQEIKKILTETFPDDPLMRDEIGTKMVSGAASTIPYLAAGFLTGGQAIPMILLGAAQAGGQEWTAGYEAANDANTLSEEKFLQKYPDGQTTYNKLKGQDASNIAFDAAILPYVAGGAEGLPVFNFFRRLNKATGGVFAKSAAKTGYFKKVADKMGTISPVSDKTALGRVIIQGVEEAGQETFTQMVTNFSAGQVYDETRKVFDGVGESAGIGGAVGVLMSGTAEMFLKALKIRKSFAKTPQEKNDIENAEKYVESIKTKANKNPDGAIQTVPDSKETEDLKRQKQSIENDFDKIPKVVVPVMQEKIDELNKQIENSHASDVEKDKKEFVEKVQQEEKEKKEAEIKKALEQEGLNDVTKDALQEQLAQIVAPPVTAVAVPPVAPSVTPTEEIPTPAKPEAVKSTEGEPKPQPSEKIIKTTPEEKGDEKGKVLTPVAPGAAEVAPEVAETISQRAERIRKEAAGEAVPMPTAKPKTEPPKKEYTSEERAQFSANDKAAKEAGYTNIHEAVNSIKKHGLGEYKENEPIPIEKFAEAKKKSETAKKEAEKPIAITKPAAAPEPVIAPEPVAPKPESIMSVAEKMRRAADMLDEINIPDTPSLFLTPKLLRIGKDAISAALRKGAEITEAIQKGIDAIRAALKSENKELLKSDEDSFKDEYTKKVKELFKKAEEQPTEMELSAGEKRVSSLKKRIVDNVLNKTTKELREILEKEGISYKVEKQRLADEYAKVIIDEIGYDDAVLLADMQIIRGGAKTMIYGRAVDKIGADIKKETAPEKIFELEQKRKEIVDKWAEENRIAGRESSAMNFWYHNSTEGIVMMEENIQQKNIEQILNPPDAVDKRNTPRAKVKQLKMELEGEQKKTAKDVAKSIVDKKIKGKDVKQKTPEQIIGDAAKKLATRIVSLLKEPKKDIDPEKLMIQTLFGKVIEKLPDVEKGKKLSDVEKIELSLKNFDEYKSVWDKSKAEVDVLIDKMNIDDAIKNRHKEKLKEYYEEQIGKPFSESLVRGIVSEKIKELPEEIEDILAKSVTERSKSKDELIKNIVDALQTKTGITDETAKDVAETFANQYDKIMEDKKQALFKKHFPDSILEKINPLKKKKQFDKIAKEVAWGVLEYPEFEKKFYAKYGLPDMSSPEIKSKLTALAEKVTSQRQGSLARLEALKEFNDYLGFIKAEHSALDYAVTQWYNNILLDFNTMAKAFEYNALKAGFMDYVFLAVKNPRNIGLITRAFFGDKGFGTVPSLNKTQVDFMAAIQGKLTGKDVAAGEFTKTNVADQLSKFGTNKFARAWGKYASASRRGLNAIDVYFSSMAEEGKLTELLLTHIKEENLKQSKEKQLTNKQIEDLTKNIIGYGKDYVQESKEIVMRDMEKKYGITEFEKLTKEQKTEFKRELVHELETSIEKRAKNVVEQNEWLSTLDSEQVSKYLEKSKQWANKSVLFGTPTGSAGALALWLQRVPSPLRIYIAPFINAPLNFANFLIGSNPITGTARLALALGKNKRGYILEFLGGKKGVELTKDDKKELIYGTLFNIMVGQGLVVAFGPGDDEDNETSIVNGKWKNKSIFITGNMYGNFEKNAEEYKGNYGLEPYTAYFKGHKLFSYKDNPLMVFFGFPAAYSDEILFRKKDDERSVLGTWIQANLAQLMMIKDVSMLSSMMETIDAIVGLNNYKNYERGWERAVARVQKAAGETAKYLVFPREVTDIARDTRALMDFNDKNAYNAYEWAIRDLPILDDVLLNDKYDFFGRPMKDVFRRELSPVKVVNGELYFYGSDVIRTDKYFGLFTSKEFDIASHRFKSKYIYVPQNEYDYKQVTIDKKTKDEINKAIGEKLRGYVDEKYNELKELKNNDFKDSISNVMSEFRKTRLTEVYGDNYVIQKPESKEKQIFLSPSQQIEEAKKQREADIKQALREKKR